MICYFYQGLSCVPPNDVGALTPRDYECDLYLETERCRCRSSYGEVVGVACSDMTGVLTERGNADTEAHVGRTPCEDGGREGRCVCKPRNIRGHQQSRRTGRGPDRFPLADPEGASPDDTPLADPGLQAVGQHFSAVQGSARGTLLQQPGHPHTPGGSNVLAY